MTMRVTCLALFSAVAAALAMTPVRAADDKVEPPPEVQELEPITVEEKRPEEDQPKKVDPEKRLKEELEKDKKAIEEIKNARGQAQVKVKGPFFTYCLNYDNNNPLTRNNVGASLIIPVYCGPGQK
jgi:hypothetical protein